MSCLSSACISTKAPVEENAALNRYRVGQVMQAFGARQRSVGLWAMREGEGALDHGSCSFGATGVMIMT